MYSYLYLCLITPVLGFVRDYSKHKYISYKKFIRTPIIYYIIYLLLDFLKTRLDYHYHINIINILIYERWIMLIYKTGLSLYKYDHIRKHNKYKLKYKSIYKNRDLLYNNDNDIV